MLTSDDIEWLENLSARSCRILDALRRWVPRPETLRPMDGVTRAKFIESCLIHGVEVPEWMTPAASEGE